MLNYQRVDHTKTIQNLQFLILLLSSTSSTWILPGCPTTNRSTVLLIRGSEPSQAISAGKFSTIFPTNMAWSVESDNGVYTLQKYTIGESPLVDHHWWTTMFPMKWIGKFKGKSSPDFPSFVSTKAIGSRKNVPKKAMIDAFPWQFLHGCALQSLHLA